MSYNGTARARQESALRDLRLKLMLEENFTKNIRIFLKNSYGEALSIYAESGKIIRFSLFRACLSKIIYKQYRIVQKYFSHQMRDEVKKKYTFYIQKKSVNTVNDSIQFALEAFALSQSDQGAMQILSTSQTSYEKIINDVASEYLQGDIPLNYDEIANEAKKELNKNATSRAKTISITETQNAAENAKFTEAERIYREDLYENYNDEILFENEDSTKDWETVGDDRVRPIHEEADGQRVNINDPFEVGGEFLMYPRDDSLGASESNIIRCRCSATYQNKYL